MTSGSCLCGTVRWRVSGALTSPNHCHCSICRKFHGAPFATFTRCAVDDFEWTAGRDNVGTYQTSTSLVRGFCRTCGSAVPDTVAMDGVVWMPVGCLDGDPGLRGGRHIFVGSKAPWHVIADQLEQFDAAVVGPGPMPPGNHPAPDTPTPGVLRGSCLCGQIAFEVDEPFSSIHNCHCSRCQKARAAAHTTNGFVALNAFRFVRGENLITDFKLPGAKRFGQAFCSHCGSAVPRKNLERQTVNVPLGSLDDAPATLPDDHIFVGSKAAWYEITDDIVQFEEGPA